MLKITVMRNRKSFDYKVFPNKPDGFDNNYKHNSEDVFTLDKDGKTVFHCLCQSVANYCFGKERPGDTVEYGDTIAPGTFQVKCFADPRQFHGEPHMIINATDCDGQKIDCNAMQTTAGGFQNGRWMIHDRFSAKYGHDTNYAWSAGCLIMSSENLRDLADALKVNGVKPGDIISGEIIELAY